MIHVSLDSDKSSAQEWASQGAFPWLTVLPEKVEKSGLRKDYKTTSGVPEYHLVDKNGNSVAKGLSASFAKIAEMQTQD